MSDDRLPTSLWVDSQIRMLNTYAVPVYVRNKGAYAGGMVIIKVVVPTDKTAQIYYRARNEHGALIWQAAFDTETGTHEDNAESYIADELAIDPDLWVLEVESASLANPVVE